MNTENQVLQKNVIKGSIQKRAKYIAIFFALLYCIILPFLLRLEFKDGPIVIYGALLGSPEAIVCTVAMFVIPISMILSVWKMRIQYIKQNYKKVYWYCALPLLTFIVSILIILAMQFLFEHIVSKFD